MVLKKTCTVLVCDAPLLRFSSSTENSTLKELEALMPSEYWLLEVMHIVNGIARESSPCALALPSLALEGQTQWEKSTYEDGMC